MEEEKRPTKTEYALKKCNDFPALGTGTYELKGNQAIAIMAMMKCLLFLSFVFSWEPDQ